MSELYDVNQPKELILKAESHRACPVCDEPIQDDKAAILPIGGGIDALVHKGCMNEIMDALTPKATTIPVSTDSKQAVSKSVTRKSTVSTSPIDKDDLKERIRYEFSLLLLKHGFLTQ